ncbi:CRISPR-associated endonuclease Cas2 [Pelagibius sp. Alg239-R121]|uniref:CRISPR-associated endonuclease Cas2 n=1 Tax=Pelagibius sp. Alg239-R121 TaxID=2993448 RepID=UPI0024A726F2|nr:CRISPR-associated endonuclease Cas2 [Pelagibius sp. Alg239-R121]
MVFCYDVVSNRQRRKVSRVLEAECVRVQRSVFEAMLTDRAARKLAHKAAQYLDSGDSLRVYSIGARGRERCLAFGPLPLPEKQPFYLL